MAFISETHMIFAFGFLGNIVSFLVYLAPLPTFYRIYKRKSTEGFQSIPYAVALFSSMLTLYYGLLKTDNGMLLITINSVGIFIESTYLLLFIIYATREAKICTSKLILFNIGILGLIIFITLKFFQGHQRLSIVGWLCAVFSVCVFVSPLSIMRLVIRTKSVEYMPFSLSFFLTLCAVMWFLYGFLIKDYFVATPNVLGFASGIVQMLLYGIYKDRNKKSVLPIFNIEMDDLEMEQEIKTVEIIKQAEDIIVVADHEDAAAACNETLESK